MYNVSLGYETFKFKPTYLRFELLLSAAEKLFHALAVMKIVHS